MKVNSKDALEWRMEKMKRIKKKFNSSKGLSSGEEMAVFSWAGRFIPEEALYKYTGVSMKQYNKIIKILGANKTREIFKSHFISKISENLINELDDNIDYPQAVERKKEIKKIMEKLNERRQIN